MLARAGIFALWALAAAACAWGHAPWRDEVRALTIALNGDSWLDMLRQLHGEGHPALWYLVLRVAHDLTGSSLVLPALGFAFTAIAAALFAFLSPFPVPMVALLLAGHEFVFEYSAVARNYGIGVLLIFALAAVYPRCRDRGLTIGLLVAALANCNAPAAVIGGAFILFWGLETVRRDGWRWTPPLRTWFANAFVAAAGAILALATIYPTYNDSALLPPAEHPVRRVVSAVVTPALSFQALVSSDRASWLPPPMIGSALLFAACLGLVRRPAALAAAFLSLIGLSVFFSFGVEGAYRHEATWFAFLIALYWIAWRDVLTFDRPLQRWGLGAFVLLAGIQAVGGLLDLHRAPGKPFSNSGNVAALVRSHQDLAGAVLISDADYVLEALPYYLPNPTYFVHEGRFGRFTRFSRQFDRPLSLGDLLREARDLRRDGPVLLLLTHPLDSLIPGKPIPYGYNWTFVASADDIAQFRAATVRLAEFRKAIADETYDVYKVK